MQEPDPASMLLRVALLLLLILINAFFAMSEIAVISLNDNKLERLAAGGNKKALRIRKLKKNAGNFLSMIQIGVTLAGFLASSAAAQSFSEPLTALLFGRAPAQMQGTISFTVTVIITLIISYVSLVLGELVPKRIALRSPEKISLMLSGLLSMFAVLMRPLVWVVSASANGVLRLFGIDPHADDSAAVTEEEIRMMVDAGGEKGVIEEAQQEMIQNIFEFDDIDVGDIMTHRTEVTGVEADDSLEDVVHAAIEDGFSRIPVYEEDMDNVIGIVYIKDLLNFIGAPLPPTNLREVMRKAYFVPETKRCGELFKEMTAQHVQIAVVVDEYGGTAGIVTLEDVLESIVGSIQDEYDDETEEIRQVDETTFLLDGTADIDEVEELTGLTFPEGDFDTIAGFVISELGYLPQAGQCPVVEFEHLRLSVLEVEDKRISAIRAEILPAEPSGQEE